LSNALTEAAGDVLHLSTTGLDRHSCALTWSGAVAVSSDRAGAGRVAPPARAVVAAPQHLPFAADSFDAVVCALLLGDHPGNPDPVLAEVARVLRPEGHLFYLEPARLARGGSTGAALVRTGFHLREHHSGAPLIWGRATFGDATWGAGARRLIGIPGR
jgi:SAM-dependent methyltransferase